MRLVGYVRVSKVGAREGDSFVSPAEQRERIAALATAGGHTVVEWVEDLDQSGSTMRRPGIERAMRLVETGEAQGIAVARLDRFSRSTVDVELGVRRLEQAGGVFLAADLGMDTSTPSGKLMRTVFAAIAEFQLDRYRETWRDATERAVARGTRGGVPPVGYDRGPGGRFVPNADAVWVRSLFVDRARGETWTTIAARYRVSHSQARRIVKSRTYLGEIRVGDLVLEHAHPPLVSRAEWEAAQSEPGVLRERRGSLLGGIIRCAGCGYAMRHESGGARGYRGYRCVRHSASGTCPAPAKIGAVRAEQHVVSVMLDELGDLRFDAEPLTDATSDAEAALEAAERELAAYRDSTAVAVVGQDVFVDGLRARQAVVNAARDALVDAAQAARVPVIGGRDWRQVWNTLELVDRRAVLAAVVDRVVCARAHRSGPGTPVEERLSVVWRDRPAEAGV